MTIVSSAIESETELIQNYLAPLASGVPGSFGLTDDAALLSIEAGLDLVITGDPIIAGVHFFPDDAAEDIAWKALAVNVSDLAAKAAEPRVYMLALAFPEAPDRSWMERFSAGLSAAQHEFGCRLIGGDTDRTPGPLSIGVTAIGTVPRGGFVRRRGASARDHVFVTGTIGDSALGLTIRRNAAVFDKVLSEDDKRALLARYLRPQPRLGLAGVLRKHASAALDISDGLLKDLARISGALGIELSMETLPLSLAARRMLASDSRVASTILGGGDDYELLVAVPASAAKQFSRDAEAAGVPVTDVGVLQAGIATTVFGGDGQPIQTDLAGYDHFSR
jgi:thiamine-monophosphate kinase